MAHLLHDDEKAYRHQQRALTLLNELGFPAYSALTLILTQPDPFQPVQIRSPADVAPLLMLDMGLLEREEVRLIRLW